MERKRGREREKKKEMKRKEEGRRRKEEKEGEEKRGAKIIQLNKCLDLERYQGMRMERITGNNYR